MVEALKEKYNPDQIGTFKVGSCIGSHSGPGVLGVLSFKKQLYLEIFRVHINKNES